MEMQLEEQRHLHDKYCLIYKCSSFCQVYQEWMNTPVDDSLTMVDPEVVYRVSFKVTQQILKIIMMYQAGELRAAAMEDCMGMVFYVIQELIWNIHQILPKAGPTLMSFLDETMKEIRDCISDLLKCTISCGPYGSLDDLKRIPDSARKALDVFKSLREIPRSNAEAIRRSLLQVMSDIRSALCEMEKKDGRSTAKSDEHNIEGKEEEAAATAEEYSQEEWRTVTALAARTVIGAFAVVAQLILAVNFRNDAYVPGLVMCMEYQLKMSFELRDHINNIKGNLFPLRDIQKILLVLDDMEATVDSMESKLQPYRSTWLDFLPRSTNLLNLIQELQCTLTNMSSTEVGAAS